MIITNIKPGKKGNILVYADGEYILSVPREVFLKTKLKLGYEITSEEIDDISSEADLYKAKSKALNILSYRSHSKKELEDKLKLKLGEDIASKTAEKMQSLGLIDDKNYASELANYLQKSKYYSVKRIKLELSKKGIDSEIISEVTENLEVYEEEIINKIISKKPIEDEKYKRRLIAKLQRLGYSWSKIKKALNEDI